MTRAARLLDVLLIVLLVAYTEALIFLLWRQPNLLALPLMLPAAVVALRVKHPRRAVVMAIVGLLLGPLTEGLCVAGGLWSYPETGGLPYVPLWIVPLWAAFPGALWIVVRSVLSVNPDERVRPRALLWALIALAIEIGLFVALGPRPVLAFAAGVPFALLLLGLARRREALLLFATGVVLGPVCEAIPNAAGAFVYALPQIFGMPSWLPLAYGIFGLLVGLAAEAAWAIAAQRSELSAELVSAPRLPWSPRPPTKSG
jgi:hypothetical protein